MGPEMREGPSHMSPSLPCNRAPRPGLPRFSVSVRPANSRFHSAPRPYAGARGSRHPSPGLARCSAAFVRSLPGRGAGGFPEFPAGCCKIRRLLQLPGNSRFRS